MASPSERLRIIGEQLAEITEVSLYLELESDITELIGAINLNDRLKSEQCHEFIKDRLRDTKAWYQEFEYDYKIVDKAISLLGSLYLSYLVLEHPDG